MNLREARDIILNEELPASEAALLLNEVNDCPHRNPDGECQIVDAVTTEDVIGLNEPF